MEVFAAMQTGEPYKSYIKTILAKLYVRVWNPWLGKEDGLIISGNPKGSDKEKCIIDVWSESEDLFLHRQNPRHFEAGYLVEYKRKASEAPQKSDNELSDEEIEVLLSRATKFINLQKRVNEMTSVAPVFRLLEYAKEKDLSTKTIAFLEAKLSELQALEYEEE